MKKKIIGSKFCSSCGNEKIPENIFLFDPNTGEQRWQLKCNTPRCSGNCADHNGHDYDRGRFFELCNPSVCRKCGHEVWYD